MKQRLFIYAYILIINTFFADLLKMTILDRLNERYKGYLDQDVIKDTARFEDYDGKPKKTC
jgi:hypothetical protein